MRRLFVLKMTVKCVRERVCVHEGERERESEREWESMSKSRQLIGKQDAAAPPSHVRETTVGRQPLNRPKERERERERGVDDGSCLGSELCVLARELGRKKLFYICRKCLKSVFGHFQFADGRRPKKTARVVYFPDWNKVTFNFEWITIEKKDFTKTLTKLFVSSSSSYCRLVISKIEKDAT